MKKIKIILLSVFIMLVSASFLFATEKEGLGQKLKNIFSRKEKTKEVKTKKSAVKGQGQVPRVEIPSLPSEPPRIPAAVTSPKVPPAVIRPVPAIPPQIPTVVKPPQIPSLPKTPSKAPAIARPTKAAPISAKPAKKSQAQSTGTKAQPAVAAPSKK